MSAAIACKSLDVFTNSKVQKVFQVAAWLLALLIVGLSLGPPSTRPVTGGGHNLEHLAIFLATGGAFGLGYPRRLWLLPFALVVFSAAIEVAQLLVSGRHARFSDFLINAAALCLGFGTSYLLLKLDAAMSKN
jgi:hypothetical protein